MSNTARAITTHATTPETPKKMGGNALEGTPWENIAAIIPRNATVEETLKVAGLDWGVEKIKAQIEFQGEMRFVDGNYALVRDTDGKILSPYMGARYKPVQNDYAFEVFEKFISAGDMTMEIAGSLHDGKHIWGLASLGDGFIIANGEEIKGYFLLMQSHAYGFALKAMFIPVRFPAGHTIVRPLPSTAAGVDRTGIYKMPHSRVFNQGRIEEIKELTQCARTELTNFKDLAIDLAGSDLSEADGIHYLAKVFDPKLINTRKERGERLPHTHIELEEAKDANRLIKRAMATSKEFPGAENDACKGTAWGYYNAVVHSIDHQMGYNENSRLESAWVGKNAGVKNQALDLAKVFAAKT